MAKIRNVVKNKILDGQKLLKKKLTKVNAIFFQEKLTKIN